MKLRTVIFFLKVLKYTFQATKNLKSMVSIPDTECLQNVVH